ncbi:hypothetical protein EVAR_34181_1 [Eumeta japonica]|uniref:Uncharacterized protein n=1 Tax=Eumeta variegata TaxID=151549 RepID=A0A4C1WI03_EUMVA|nr:hypothetical protein EVAR_34181_1 [Eumeta japonica]
MKTRADPPAMGFCYEYQGLPSECLADSIEHQCSDNPPYDLEHVRRVDEKVRHRVSLPSKDDLDPITQPHHSCPQQALRLVEYISEGFKVERKTVTVFFDVAKAFDRVWHAERFFDVASSHPNPLLVSAVSYEPPPPHHLYRRSRNVLLDPPDDLTVKMEKLIDVNKMAID